MLNVQKKQFHKWDITCFLGKNVFLLSCLTILVNFWNDKGIPVKKLAAYTYLWQTQESHLLNRWKRTGFYYTMYLSVECYHSPQHFTKIKSHILKYMKTFPCTKGDYFQVYKHNQVIFPGRKIHFSVACLQVWSKMIIMLLNINLYINVSMVQKIHRINHCKGKLFQLSVTVSA